MGIAPIQVNVTVATAGVRVRLFPATTYASAFYCEALDSNTGSIYLGNSTVSSTRYMRKMGAATGFSMNAQAGAQAGTDGGLLELSQLWADATTAAQVLCVTYLPLIDKY